MIELIIAALVISGVGVLAANNAINGTMTEGMARAGQARVYGPSGAGGGLED